MRHTLNACLLASLGTSLISGIAYADETAAENGSLLDAVKNGKPMTSFRLRYETVNQDSFQPPPDSGKKLDTAHGLTLRSLVGWQTAPFRNFSFSIQLTDVHEFTDDFNDRRNNVSEPGKGDYPNIVDPGYTDINQLYVDWTGMNNTRLRLGRQQVNLDNVRFIGDIGFRQNMQVFDGISVLNKSLPDMEIFAAHFSKVRQVNTELRDGNMDIVNAKYRLSPSENLVGYGYFIDVANLSQNGGIPASPGFTAQGGNGLGASSDAPLTSTAATDASSRTFGIRFDGIRKLSAKWKALYTTEYAKQDDYKDGSELIDAHYFKIGGGAMYGNWSLRIDHEVLSSNDGQYAFQTPLGTNHLFQGWADQFLVTPRQGIKDTFVTMSTSIDKAKLHAEYHVFHADENYESLGRTALNRRLGDRYGTELDISLLYPFTEKLSGKLEYAKFNEGDIYGPALAGPARKTDKEIVWVTAMYTF